jgi:penicillin-binding protein 1A
MKPGQHHIVPRKPPVPGKRVTSGPLAADRHTPRPQGREVKPRSPGLAGAFGGWLEYLPFRLALIVLPLLFLPIAAAIVGYYHFSQDLPSIESLHNYRPKTVSFVYADDGRTIGEFAEERRLVLPLSRVPRRVILAFVAAEDANFYNHPGLDILGISRALVRNVQAGRIVQGGSTITQQVTRSFLLSNEKTMDRKIREALLAYRIEQNLSKDEILFLYLNQIYLGHGAYGIESAANVYFGKHVSELTLAEAAMIAGLTRAPSRYSPFRAPQRARLRQAYVINRMLEVEFISLAEAAVAMEEKLNLVNKPDVNWDNTPEFTEHIRRTITELYGSERLYGDGLRIYTTVNVDMQEKARAEVRKGLRTMAQRHRQYSGPRLKVAESQVEEFLKLHTGPLEEGQEYEALVRDVQPKTGGLSVLVGQEQGLIPYRDLSWALQGRAPEKVFAVGDVIPVLYKGQENGLHLLALSPQTEAQGALVCMENQTGRVKAMVGCRDFRESQFNRAVQARRQPGSSFKPFIYSAALDSGFTQASNINDIEVAYQDGDKIWTPKNYGRAYGGPTTLFSGLTRSVNVVAVRLLEKVGVNKVIEYARRMGIKSPLGPNLSLALGTSEVTLLEMVAAFTTFPNQGERVEPIFINRIEDRDGRIVTEFGPQRFRALSPETAYLMLDMLRGVVQRGTGSRVAALGRPVAGKTGTTNDLADAWFIGFTPEYCTGVWVGNDRRVSLGSGEQGGRTAAPIFLWFMEDILKDVPPSDFAVPLGVTRGNVTTGRADETGEIQEVVGYYCFKKGSEGPGPRSEAPMWPEPEEDEDYWRMVDIL